MMIRCLRLRDISVICRVVNPRRIDVAENLGRFLVRSAQSDFELIPAVEMDTRNPIVGYFGSEFSAICNVAELWRPEFARRKIVFKKFCVIWKNDPLR